MGCETPYRKSREEDSYEPWIPEGLPELWDEHFDEFTQREGMKNFLGKWMYRRSLGDFGVLLSGIWVLGDSFPYLFPLWAAVVLLIRGLYEAVIRWGVNKAIRNLQGEDEEPKLAPKPSRYIDYELYI